MSTSNPIEQLAAMSRAFGSAAARDKLRLLEQIAELKRCSARHILLLHDTLVFMLAYPDSAPVLESVAARMGVLRKMVDDYTDGDCEHPVFMNTGIPGSCNTYPYSYAVLQRLVRLYPDDVEIDWDAFDEDSPIVDALDLTLARAESRGLQDEYTSLREWLELARPDSSATDLASVVRLFEGSSLDVYQQMHVFETYSVPIRFRLAAAGSGRCEARLTPAEASYQRQPIRRERFRLKPKIMRPIERHRRLTRKDGRAMLDLALSTLCCRNLEIQPLIYANPDDVTLVEFDRGVHVLLAGTVPEFRPVMESDFFFLILKNGIPIAYGPASVFLGCCEMGINLFEEFRGGEIRYIYAQFMRALYHLAHARYFFLTSYGMGEGNPEALRSGAFWFYRKLGFKPTNPDVESFAREEEVTMRRKPGHRSSMQTLRKLSMTEAYLDLSNGTRRPVHFEAIGQALSRDIAVRFGGDRTRAERESTRWAVQFMGVKKYDRWTVDEKRAMRRWAPLVPVLAGARSWPMGERWALAAMIKAKGADNESDYLRRALDIPSLPLSLRQVTGHNENGIG